MVSHFPTSHCKVSEASSHLLSKTAGDVSSTLHSQLRTLEETRKVAQVVPALQQSTQQASTWIKTILESVKSFPATSEDIFNIKENVETLKRLALGTSVEHESLNLLTALDDQLQKTQNPTLAIRKSCLSGSHL